MGIVDFILNLAGLLLWLNWRSLRFDPLAKRTPATLMGTLRPASPKKFRRWHLLLILAGMLVVRAVAYRWVAPFWVARLDLGVTVPSFRSDDFSGMLLFSVCSFLLVLDVFYVALLLLSLLRGPDPIHRLVKIPLGRVDDWPRAIKTFLPLLLTAAGWWTFGGMLVHLKICPPPLSLAHRLEQGLFLGLDSYLVWKFPLGALLALHLLNSYIYFGSHPVWNYVHVAAGTILRPLHKFPLRFGRVDFAPVIGLILIFLLVRLAENGVQTPARMGPDRRVLPPLINIPGLVDGYRQLSVENKKPAGRIQPAR